MTKTLSVLTFDSHHGKKTAVLFFHCQNSEAAMWAPFIGRLHKYSNNGKFHHPLPFDWFLPQAPFKIKNPIWFDEGFEWFNLPTQIVDDMMECLDSLDQDALDELDHAKRLLTKWWHTELNSYEKIVVGASGKGGHFLLNFLSDLDEKEQKRVGLAFLLEVAPAPAGLAWPHLSPDLPILCIGHNGDDLEKTVFASLKERPQTQSKSWHIRADSGAGWSHFLGDELVSGLTNFLRPYL